MSMIHVGHPSVCACDPKGVLCAYHIGGLRGCTVTVCVYRCIPMHYHGLGRVRMSCDPVLPVHCIQCQTVVCVHMAVSD